MLLHPVNDAGATLPNIAPLRVLGHIVGPGGG